MKAKCSKCHETYTLSVEEEELLEAGYLSERICDDCYYDSEIDPCDIAEYMSYSDADCGL